MSVKSIMSGVTEYTERFDVELAITNGTEDRKGYGRLVIRAYNEGGYRCTDVDLRQVLDWVRINRPDLLENA